MLPLLSQMSCWAVFVYYLSCLLTIFLVGVSEGSCVGCNAEKLIKENIITTEELKKIRVELIKQQILQKLRLKAPPVVNISVLQDVLINSRLIDESVREDYDFNRDDFYGTTREVVIFPDNSNTHNCYTRETSHPNSCFRFQLTSEVTTRSVSSAELWVYKVKGPKSPTALHQKKGGDMPKNVTYTVMEVQPNPNLKTFSKRVVAIEDTIGVAGWMKFEIAPAVRTWSLKKHMAHALEITCEGCETDLESPVSVEGDRKPFIVVHADAWKEPSRRKRSYTCTQQSVHCCKEHLKINFSEINWHKWILHPSSYEANFCRGACVTDVSASLYYHTTVLRRYIQHATPPKANLALCCTPSKLRPLTLVYLDEQNNIYKTALPNMIVESCNCA